MAADMEEAMSVVTAVEVKMEAMDVAVEVAVVVTEVGPEGLVRAVWERT